MVRVPVCCSEVAHGVRCVSQARMDASVGFLGVTRPGRDLLLLPPLKAGCFRVQITFCTSETNKQNNSNVFVLSFTAFFKDSTWVRRSQALTRGI